jgi:NAD(P)-dependent dehydrogenase (short-subunit alcohol dehydrogenase family)
MVGRGVEKYFAHKHVVITGGSEGLGLEVARQLARLQARVSLIARTESKLAAAASSIASEPGAQRDRIHYATADVSQYQQVCGARTWSACWLLGTSAGGG